MAHNSRPNIFAASITKTGKCTHTPSMFIVAPSGKENELKPRSTPRESAALKETGNVAADERVTKAVRMGSRILNITLYGFSRQNSAIASG
jgi:hypothetical protein